MKSLGNAIHLRNHLIDLLQEADFECVVGERDTLLTVVVAGGTTETVAAVSDFLREATKDYRHLGEDHIRVVLVHPRSVTLPELGATLGSYAQRKLAGRKVEIRVRCAAVPDRTSGRPYPTTAQHAMCEGRRLAHQRPGEGRRWPSEAIGVLDIGIARGAWKKNSRCADCRRELLRMRGLVPVAFDLSEQAGAPRKRKQGESRI
jgi:hypothetical protein